MTDLMRGFYTALHSGASGGTKDPVEHQQKLMGGMGRTSGEETRSARNEYNTPNQDPFLFNLGPGRGQAASLPRETRGTPASDKSIDTVLDGFTSSQLADHPDGQYAQNVAATSNDSAMANWEALTQKWVRTSTIDSGKESEQTVSWTRDRAVQGVLSAQRSQRLQDAPELMVAPPGDVRWTGTASKMLRGEFTAPQLFLMTAAMYGLMSSLM